MSEESFSFDSLNAEQVGKFDLLAGLLQRENAKYNLTRIVDDEGIRQRHFCDSLAAVDVINKCGWADESRSIIDIGSGAGLPGMALAIALPDTKITSVDATGKKIQFQQMAAGELGLENFKPIQDRAEELARESGHRQRYDFAVSRAVANLSVLLELAMPLVRVGGYFLAWKGSKADEEIANAENALAFLGSEVIEQVPYTIGDQGEGSDLRIVVIKKVKPTKARYPRVFRSIKQNPL